MSTTISCAIIVYNEERNIRDCLESAKWMDEIVVVDSFSQDKTIEISREYTDRVFYHTWNGYGEQKNFAIDQATTNWVFIMDADERVTAELRGAIERILKGDDSSGPAAYYVPRRNYFYGKWIQRAGCYPDYQLRLFRRGVGRMDNAEPHPQFICTGKVSYLTQPLDHYSVRTVDDHFKKINNLTNLAARERGKTKSVVHWSDLVVRPLFTFWKYFVARRGFQEGMHGIVFCIFASMYTFVKYAKLWESTCRTGDGGQMH